MCEINVTGWKGESKIIRHKQFNVVILENRIPIYYRENKDGNIIWLCGDRWWYFPGLTALPVYSTSVCCCWPSIEDFKQAKQGLKNVYFFLLSSSFYCKDNCTDFKQTFCIDE